MGELLFLLSLLAVRRMRREHIRTMSKNADNEHPLEEWSTLHPCFINIFAVICCCVLFEKDVLTLSQGVSVCQTSFPLSTRHLTIDRFLARKVLLFSCGMGPRASAGEELVTQMEELKAFVVDDVLPPWKPRFVEVRGTVQAFPEGGKEIVKDFAPDILRITPTYVVSLGINNDIVHSG